MVRDLFLGDIVRLRKPHPCGGTDWRIDRLGADIGLICLTCQHRILMPRATCERRIKAIIARGRDSGSQADLGAEAR